MEHNIQRKYLSQEKATEVIKLAAVNAPKLYDYISKLLWWNKKVNLVSRNVPRETIQKHIEHSLVVSASKAFQESDKIIDSGTGGGLPGIPLAIAYPKKKIVLNDIVSKKIMACKHMSTELGLKNVASSMVSLEMIKMAAGALLISKHAFKINDLLKMIDGKSWGKIVLLKGSEEVESELEGVNTSLDICITELESGFLDPFYSGKAMVEIQRKERDE